jgi:hypothetical protein
MDTQGVIMKNLLIKLLVLALALPVLTSCQQGDGSDDTSTLFNTDPITEVEDGVEDNSNDDTQTTQASATLIYGQDFQNFDFSGSWTLSDFNLAGESQKEDYVSGTELLFDIRWTKRTRNLLADRLGYQRSQMTHAFTNSLCEPKIEIGKENVYTNSNSDNVIAELDTDLNHCNISGNEPAAIAIRSFVPTKVGYKYKVAVSYKMRTYNGMTENSYRDLVVRFGSNLEKFDPEFNEFKTVELNMIAARNYSKLVLKDNGLPNSYGILIDNIEVYELGKVDNYDECANLFSKNSKGFKKCVQGEIDTSEECNFNDPSTVSIKVKNIPGVAANRRVESNIFNVSPAQDGQYNFFALGLKGKVTLACTINGHKALYDIYGKTLSLREISWGNATVASYPEVAKVRVKLEGCLDDSLNRVKTVGTVSTNEVFAVTFDQDSEGKSYEGCKMSKVIIKDITPNGPSTDGFDLNSFQLN